MRQVAAAAGLYFAIVFGVGFLLGPIRVLWLEPRVGMTLAVLIEAPILVAAMAVAARWVPRRLGMANKFLRLAAMGFVALALVLVSDFTVGRWLRGLAPLEQLSYLATPAGLVYVATLVLFTLMPLIVNVLLDDGL